MYSYSNCPSEDQCIWQLLIDKDPVLKVHWHYSWKRNWCFKKWIPPKLTLLPFVANRRAQKWNSIWHFISEMANIVTPFLWYCSKEEDFVDGVTVIAFKQLCMSSYNSAENLWNKKQQHDVLPKIISVNTTPQTFHIKWKFISPNAPPNLSYQTPRIPYSCSIPALFLLLWKNDLLAIISFFEAPT